MSRHHHLLPFLASFDSVICLIVIAITLQCASASRVPVKAGISTPIHLTVPDQSNSMKPSMTLFMHDILGGSAPSGRVVVGTVANTGVTNLPFSKPNKGLFPLHGGIPLVNPNAGINNLNGVVSGRNVPFFAGAGGNENVIADKKNLPFVTAGKLPATLQSLTFGTITVIDDEITEGQELGSSVIGKAQGFHLASSLDGSSRTMAFTMMFVDGSSEEEKEEDSISLFGVHRTAAAVSLIAIVGGTGKYAEASGYAEIETVHGLDEHITDGVEMLLQLNIYLA